MTTLMTTLRRLRPLAVVALLTLTAACENDKLLSHDFPAQPCVNLFVVERDELGIVLPVGVSVQLRVRLTDGPDSPGGADLYRHCPSMTLDEFEWTIEDSNVARLEGRGEEVTITTLEVGRTVLWVRYGDYVDPLSGRIQLPIGLEVVAEALPDAIE